MDSTNDQVPGDQSRRRRRVRHPADAEPQSTDASQLVDPAPSPTVPTDPSAAAVPAAAAVAVTSATDDLVPETVAAPEPTEPDPTPAERGLRGLIGGGSSQVKPTAALRARDAARPRDSDIARAEADLVIVRRNWTPRD